MNKLLLTTLEAAEYLGFTKSKLENLKFLGRVPYVQIGRSIRYTKEQLDQWIVENSVEAKAEDSK